MKKLFLVAMILSLTVLTQAQVYNTINIDTPGTLSTALTTGEQTTITNLTITGTIDQRDFTTMRNNMVALKVIDLSAVTIVAYGNYLANTIPHSSFSNKSITSILLPASATEINANAFSGCSSLTTITIPASITTIETCVFYGCSAFVTVDANNPNYSSQDGILFNKDLSTLISCPSNKTGSYTIPSTVTLVDQFAFDGCTGISSISMSSVQKIGLDAFDGCTSLISVAFPSTLTSIGDRAFHGCTNLTVANLPPSVSSMGKATFYSCTNLATVTLPTSLQTIPDQIFYQCTSLLSIIIPASVDTIGIDAFYYAGLRSIIIPNTVKYIKEGAFDGCYYLTSINIPNSIKIINQDVFYNTGISSVIIPSSVDSIENNAFQCCTKLTKVTLPASVKFYGFTAFAYCPLLDTVKIYATTPPAVSTVYTWNLFYGVKSTCILYVPTGTKALYQASKHWKDLIVQEFNATNITNNVVTPFHVSSQNGQVQLCGVPIGESVTIYSLQGNIIYSQQANTNTVEVCLPTRGVYVVKVGEQSVKVFN